MVRETVFVTAVFLYLLVYNVIGVIEDDNLVTALSAQIQVSIALIGMVRKPSVDPIVLGK